MSTTTPAPTWQQAQKAPFEAFGILYYPLFRTHADLPTEFDDADMVWAVTANANLDGSGYTLSQPAILALAAAHHALTDLARTSPLLPLADAAEAGPNPLDDLRRLVPDVDAQPLYPDFPQQVMALSEAQFRYDQACHYLSTYGVEYVAGLLGLDVQVSEGWRPRVEATPKDAADETLVAPTVLHVLLSIEDLQAVVAARLARATRMHEAEIDCAVLAFGSCDDASADVAGAFPRIAFHENMMALIRSAASRDAATLERVAAGFAQHPGDLLKATRHLLEATPKNHLSTAQKKGLCRAFEHFETRAIARNIADAGRRDRLAPNFLSVARFGGPKLVAAVALVKSGQMRSWTSQLESLWAKVGQQATPDREAIWQQLVAGHAAHPDTSVRAQFDAIFHELYGSDASDPNAAWQALLAHYGERPGVLLRSLARLVKAGCPEQLLVAEATKHVETFSLPTLVSTLTALSNEFDDPTNPLAARPQPSKKKGGKPEGPAPMDRATRTRLVALFRALAERRMQSLETPLRGKKVYLDTAGFSLVGSAVRPNETGNTGTAWPPTGMALDLPADKTLRFFTFWDDRATRVDVDLHFQGRYSSGEAFHIGWNADFRGSGMVTSGDVTTSVDSVEYLDLDMAAARANDVDYVVQNQHIYAGRPNWGEIQTCYSGALVVGDTDPHVALFDSKNLLFRDDLTGTGRTMDYAAINVPHHYVRILRGAKLPYGELAYSLQDYLDALFRAQGVTLVAMPEEAELRVCVGRSDDPAVVSLFDAGFYLG